MYLLQLQPAEQTQKIIEIIQQAEEVKKEKDLLLKKPKKDLVEKIYESANQLQDQKHQLQALHQLQTTKAATQMKEILRENNNLKSLLFRKTEESIALKKRVEAAELKIHNDSEQFKIRIQQFQLELRTNQEEKHILRKAHENQLETLKQGFETERLQLLDTSKGFKSTIEQLKTELQTAQEENGTMRDAQKHQSETRT
jgi:hypothetical protein